MKRPRYGTLFELPPAPDSISSEARGIYTRCGQFLVGREMLADGDVPALAAYAVALARAFSLDRDVEARGLFVDDKRNPSIGAAQQAHAVAKAWAQALALVPVSRRSLAAGPAATPYDDGESSALASLLADPRGKRPRRASRALDDEG